MFTLLDKSPFYGNVNRTLQETSLSDASILLNATIRAGKLYIPFIVDKDTVIIFETLIIDRNYINLYFSILNLKQIQTV